MSARRNGRRVMLYSVLRGYSGPDRVRAARGVRRWRDYRLRSWWKASLMQFDRRGTGIGGETALWARKTVNWLLMKLMKVSVSALVAAGFVASVVPGSRAQQRPAPNKELIAARHATENAL